MNLRLILAVGCALLATGVAAKDQDVIKRFLNTVAAGSDYQLEDFVNAPTEQEIAYLAMLKGCKSSILDTVNGRKDWVIGWKCPKKSENALAIVYLVNGKIDRILPSERIR